MKGPTDLQSRPEATTYSVEEIIRLAREGRLRVPSFQRGFKWSGGDVRAFFDSIVRGFPIGTLLLWRRAAPSMSVTFGDVSIRAAATEHALWLVDGQQRVHSLVATLLREPSDAADDFALYWDLESRELRRRTRKDPPRHWLPLHRLADVSDLWEWVRRQGQEPHIKEAERLAKTVREYSVPAYEVEQDDESVLRTIFDRMNNAGRPLSRAEVFNALHASGDAHEPSSLKQLVERVRRAPFGALTDDRVLQTVLALRGGDVYRDLHGEFGPDENPAEAYTQAEVALAAATTFLIEQVGIPRVELLPASFVVVPLARFFHLHPEPSARTRVLLRRWVWRVASLEGVGGRTEVLRQAVNAVEADEDASAAALLGLLRDVPRSDRLSLPKSYAFNQARAKLAVLAMADQAPVDLVTREQLDIGALVSRQGAEAMRPIFAPSVVRSTAGRGSIANRLLQPASGASDLRGLLLDAAPTDLAGHVVDARAMSALRRDDAERFLARREAALEDVLNDFVASRAEWERSDRPALATAVVGD